MAFVKEHLNGQLGPGHMLSGHEVQGNISEDTLQSEEKAATSVCWSVISAVPRIFTLLCLSISTTEIIGYVPAANSEALIGIKIIARFGTPGLTVKLSDSRENPCDSNLILAFCVSVKSRSVNVARPYTIGTVVVPCSVLLRAIDRLSSAFDLRQSIPR